MFLEKFPYRVKFYTKRKGRVSLPAMTLPMYKGLPCWKSRLQDADYSITAATAFSTSFPISSMLLSLPSSVQGIRFQW